MKPEDLRPGSYYEHVERPATAAPGVRVVEFLKLAYNKDAPVPWHELAIYRPLDPTAFVYTIQGWDHRPVAEFLDRYRPVVDQARINQLNDIKQGLYTSLADGGSEYYRLLVFQEGDWWVGQCFERDIAVQATTFDGVEDAFKGQVEAYRFVGDLDKLPPPPLAVLQRAGTIVLVPR